MRAGYLSPPLPELISRKGHYRQAVKGISEHPSLAPGIHLYPEIRLYPLITRDPYPTQRLRTRQPQTISTPNILGPPIETLVKCEKERIGRAPHRKRWTPRLELELLYENRPIPRKGRAGPLFLLPFL